MSRNLATQKSPLNIPSTYYFKQFDLEKQILKNFKDAGFSDIANVRDEFLIFDLSESYWHDLGALLWLISFLHKLKKQRNDLQLIFPEPEDDKGKRVWEFLIRWRFFETLSLCVDDPVNLLKPHQVPYMGTQSKYAFPTGIDEYGEETILHSLRLLEITTIRTDAEKFHDDSLLGHFLGKYYDKVIISALSQLCGWGHSLTKTFVQRVMREGLQNSLLHSEGSFSNISMRIDAKNLTVVISDNGIGIPKVLRDAFKRSGIHKALQKESDVELIKYFTEPDMVLDSRLIKLSVEKGTSSKTERRGLGLYYLKSLVLSHGGELRIRSGKACVDFTKSRQDSHDTMLDSPGTMLRIQTPLK